MSSNPDVSIIILNWNTREMLAECLKSLEQSIVGFSYEIIVVDNASSDGSVEMVRQQFPAVQCLVNSENVGFARANNQAMAGCRGRYALLFNSDAFARPDSLEAMVKLVETQPRIGMVGAHLLNMDGSFQASHSPFPNLWQEFLILTGLGRLMYGYYYPSRGPEVEKGPQIVDYVEGACMLVRLDTVREVGGLDEGYFMYAEEVDWCFAMRRAGWQVWYQPQAPITHYGSGSSRNRRTGREADLYRSRVRFFRKNYGDLPALALKLLIYAITAAKIPAHQLLRLLSRNRKGRPVVGMGDLIAMLREV